MLNRRQEAPALATGTPKPRPVTNCISDDELATYKGLAEKLGFKPAGLVEAEILVFCKKEGIELYDWREVYQYLWSRLPDNTLDLWIKPLREQDGNALQYYKDNQVCVRTVLYKKMIPFPVLQRVERFAKAFADSVQFLVIDDLFLAIRARSGVDFFIADAWEEETRLSKLILPCRK